MSQAKGRLCMAVFNLANREGPLKQRLISALTYEVMPAIDSTLPPELCERLQNLKGKVGRSEPVFGDEGHIAPTIRGMGRKELAEVARELIRLCLDVTAYEGPPYRAPHDG